MLAPPPAGSKPPVGPLISPLCLQLALPTLLERSTPIHLALRSPQAGQRPPQS